MKQTHKLFRCLVDAALDDQRRWSSVGELAWEAGVGESWAYKALAHPIAIGSVTKLSGGGISVTDPERILMILSAKRSLAGARRTTLDATQSLISSSDAYAIGGTRAASRHLGGSNTIADHAEAIVYVPDSFDLQDLPAGEGALVLLADERSMRDWSDGFTSRAQTFADLFAQPGWQASEFRRALWRAWFEIDDWSRKDA
ncbi:MAG: hypothetical protein KDC46_13545 [Thermoleophilia bacterium]|nr:hypothetical protein [Thermoleophilia bacterium]